MSTARVLPHGADLRRGFAHPPAIGEPAIDWSRLAFLESRDGAHALKINSLYEAQAALLILKTMAGEKRPYIDEAADACARGLIHTQYHCVTRELIVRHAGKAPTEASISAILEELKDERWPVRMV
jgi:hypothetical protein